MLPSPVVSRHAVSVVFAVHGLVSGSWLPHIPVIKAGLGLSDGALGLVLLAPPAGALLTMPLTGAACARWGSGVVTRLLVVVYTAGFVLVGFGVGRVWSLVVALLLAGALLGSLDVSMNAQAATTERAVGKPIMGAFHAVWSIAAAVGAGIGGAAAQFQIPLSTQMVVLAVVAVIVVVPFTTRFLRDDGVSVGKTARRWRIEKGLIVLSLVAFSAQLAEGAAADWSALYLAQTQDSAPFIASLGYTVFAVAMFLGRLLGDQLVSRFGRARSIFVAAITGGIGMAGGLVAAQSSGPSTFGRGAVMVGFFVLGLGIAVVVPVVFSTAGDGPGIAMVSTGGYTGWLLGPAVIGGLAEWLSLGAAIWAIPVLAILAGLFAPWGIGSVRKTTTRDAPEPHLI